VMGTTVIAELGLIRHKQIPEPDVPPLRQAASG
jgi:hypothetical protein